MGLNSKDQSELIMELLATVRQLQADNAKIMEQVLVGQQKQSEMMIAWFGMFKAPQEPNQSTGLDQRLLAKESQEGDVDWEPLSPTEMLEITKMIGTG